MTYDVSLKRNAKEILLKKELFIASLSSHVFATLMFYNVGTEINMLTCEVSKSS